MGRRGNPYDNAKAESFMKTLKVEAVYLAGYETHPDVLAHLPRFIDEVCNQTRLPSAISALLSSSFNMPGSPSILDTPTCPPAGAHSRRPGNSAINGRPHALL
jgi:transposase InsO family protein